VEIIVVIVLGIMVATWLRVGGDANLTWLYLALTRTWQSILQAVGGLVVSYSVLLITFILLSSVFHFRHSKPLAYAISVLGALFLVSAVNVWPITMYLEIFNGMGFDVGLTKILCLSLANGMFFFIFYDVLTKSLDESRKTYIISSRYRGKTEKNALLEYFVWSVLNLSGSIFYYIFSFTLFVDLFFYSISEAGILTSIFHEILNEGWTEKALFDLAVMLACVLSVRTLLQLLAIFWEMRRDLVVTVNR